ncbi:MAG: hypothetical protein KC646_16715 [Candidatus Cloacimonetes bacterium]|nr:hypothetical protein [Candidatus Cloacimonadota bacterium]
MKLQSPTKKSTKGFAIVVVLLLVVMVPPVLFGLHRYLISKTKNLSILEAHSILQQEARNALKEVEISLMNARWYLPKHHHSYELSANFKSKVTVYIDEYESIHPQYIYSEKMGLTPTLDHIKVFIHLSYKEKEVIAYGKFVISPSPILVEDSVHGVNGYKRSTLEEEPSIRKYVYQEIVPKNYILKTDDKILDIAKVEDRATLAMGLDLQLQRATIQNFLQKPAHIRAKRYLQVQQQKESKKQVFKLFYALGEQDFDENITDSNINQYLIEKSKNFHFDFDKPSSKRNEILSIIEIRNSFEKNQREQVIKDFFEKRLTKQKKSAFLSKIYKFQNEKGPVEHYYHERNVEQHIALPTTQFINTISGFASGKLFQVQWRATCGSIPSNGDFEDFVKYYQDFNARKSLFNAEDCGGIGSFDVISKNYQQFYHPLKLSDNKERSIQLKYILEYFHKQVTNTPAVLASKRKPQTEPIVGGLAQFIH